MLHLQWSKGKKLNYLFLVCILFVSISSIAQKEIYMEDHDIKPYYFGISLGVDRTKFHTELDKEFLAQDSIFTAEPTNTSGFNLGLSATARLSPRFEVRFNPQLVFLERDILYHLKYQDLDNGLNVTKKVESVITTFPLHIKFLSDRIGNFRVYMLAGGKVDLDLASNAQARKADDMIKIGRSDYGVEGGIGFNFYHQSFILSPEIKFSNGLNNLHIKNDKLNYSRVLDGIKSRMIMFTIHLEG